MQRCVCRPRGFWVCRPHDVFLFRRRKGFNYAQITDKHLSQNNSYLAEEPGVTVLERRAVLPGYELYLVEQWACSRRSPTLVIVTYTGDPKHSVNVGVLSIPAVESDRSPALRHYFNAIQQYHARPRETPLGELMVTNLSSFPSALTVISVPDGDLRKHREIFIVNENLKRLGCSGRSGLTLSEPSPATQAKFLQLYKTCDRIPLYQAVVELVKVCQAALFLFGKLEQEFIDGLLCDMTETAISNWWIEIGSEYFNMEPSDGILGPTTVAAILGTLMGARNRLHWWGAAVGKDVFDIDSTKRGINQFQKAMKLERTRRLDRPTLLKLHSVTAKAAAGEGGWGVQRAVKSTVAEIGGKRGEIVMGFVSGGRDKGNIADIETLDIDKFISLAYGERSKWLWHGKPKRSTSDHPNHQLSDAAGGSAFGNSKENLSLPSTSSAQLQQLPQQDQPRVEARRTQTLPPTDDLVLRSKDESATVDTTHSAPPGSADSPPGDRDALRKTVFKRVGGKVNDARSGIGRTIRDAIGGGHRSGHQSKPSKDGHVLPDGGIASPSIASLAHSATSMGSPVLVGRAFTWKNKPEEYKDAMRIPRDAQGAASGSVEGRTSIAEEGPDTAVPGAHSDTDGHLGGHHIIESSVADSVADESDTHSHDRALAGFRKDDTPPSWIQRRHSLHLPLDDRPINDARWPRRMSFSVAADSVLWWDRIADLVVEAEPVGNSHGSDGTVDNGGEEQKIPTLVAAPGNAELARAIYTRIAEMKQTLMPWTEEKIRAVALVDGELGRQQDELASLLDQFREAYEAMRRQSVELLSDERGQLTEAVRDVEGLAQRLDYEINALASKIADVEDGVQEFEIQVEMVEAKAEELKTQLETETWVHWAMRKLTGIGSGPNIIGGQVPVGGLDRSPATS